MVIKVVPVLNDAQEPVYQNNLFGEHVSPIFQMVTTYRAGQRYALAELRRMKDQIEFLKSSYADESTGQVFSLSDRSEEA